jgi:hypothetical protein
MALMTIVISLQKQKVEPTLGCMKFPYPLYKSNNSSLLEDPIQLEIFKDKSFLEFNSIIGLPVKNGIEHPMYHIQMRLQN